MKWPIVLFASALMIFGLLGPSQADEKKEAELTKKIEELEVKLEKLSKLNESLKKENASLRAKLPTTNKKTLSDLLLPDSTIDGDYQFITGDKKIGTWALVVKERDGKKFKGNYSGQSRGGNPFEFDVEGELIGNRLWFKSVNSAQKLTVQGEMKGTEIKLAFLKDGKRADMVAKAPDEPKAPMAE